MNFILNFEFFLFLIIFEINLCTIVLPIETIAQENYLIEKNNSHSNIIKKFYFKDIYTIIEIGNPIQKVPLFIRTKKLDYEISNFLYNNLTLNLKYNLSYNLFNENKSLSFKTKGCKDVVGYLDDVETVCESNDTFIFYVDINMNQKINYESFYFKLVKYEDNISPGEIGLGLFNKNYDYENNFLKILRKYNLINNYYWYFDFNSWNDTKGKLILGSLPHKDNPNKFSEDDLVYTNIDIDSSIIRDWKIEFNKIYINNNNNNSKSINLFFKKAELIFDSDFIIGTNELEVELDYYIFKSFKINQNFFNETFKPTDYSSLRFYYFNIELKEILYESIPSIKFTLNDFNYTFEITKEDLFIIEGNYIYLKILFPILQQKQQNYFILGKSITLKYPFIFNSDLKQIGFYKKYNKSKEIVDNNENKYILIKIIIIVIASIILILIGLKLGKMIYGANRKKRANELSDDYEYFSEDKKKEDNNKNDLDINEKNTIEKNIK